MKKTRINFYKRPFILPINLFLSLLFIFSIFSTSLISCISPDITSTLTTENNVAGTINTTVTSDVDETIGIIVSIPPQAEFVEKIGGQKVSVTIMVPPGAEPHSYEPNPEQLKAVSNAKVYFKLGSGIEFELAWLDKIIALNKKMKVFDCAENIEIIDPHIWLSLKNAVIITENIYRGLSEVDPVNSEYYISNLNLYTSQLEELDKKIAESLSARTDTDAGSKKIMVYHSAWKYFARDYGLEEIAVENLGKEPTIKQLEMLIAEARANNIKVIFASPQFSTKSAEVVAKEVGAVVILIDPLNKDYLANMEHIAEEFKDSF